jgi:hypothetical protein
VGPDPARRKRSSPQNCARHLDAARRVRFKMFE